MGMAEIDKLTCILFHFLSVTETVEAMIVFDKYDQMLKLIGE